MTARPFKPSVVTISFAGREPMEFGTSAIKRDPRPFYPSGLPSVLEGTVEMSPRDRKRLQRWADRMDRRERASKGAKP